MSPYKIVGTNNRSNVISLQCFIIRDLQHSLLWVYSLLLQLMINRLVFSKTIRIEEIKQ